MMRSLPAWTRNPALIAAVVTAVYLGLVLGLMRLQYISNDDVTIMDFARSGFPVRYMGILLTNLLHFCYDAAPQFGWYALALYTLDALCIFLWVMLALHAARSWWLRAVLIVAVLGFCLRHLAFLDYTATSALLCSAAVAWACLMALEGSKHRHLLLPGLVLMLGMVVRPHGVPGAFLFTLPLLLTTALICLREAPRVEGARRLAVCSLLFLLPSLVEFGMDQAWRAATATPQQMEYEAFNAVRGRIHRLNSDRKQALAQDRTALLAASMTAQDVHRLYDWEFLDERIYTPAALQTLLDHAPPLQASIQDWREALSDRVRLQSPFFELMLLGLPLLLAAWPRQRWALLPALAMPLWYPILTAGMSLLFIFPSRVEHPFVVGTGLAACLLAARLAASRPPSRRQLVATLMTAALALFSSYANLRGEASHYDGLAKRADRAQQNLDELNRDFAGSVILIQPQWGLPLEMLDPLHPPQLHFQPVQLGWSTYSPRFYRQIGALGITQGHELVGALAGHEQAYVLSQQGWPSRLYDAKAPCAPAMTEVRRFPNGIFLYRLRLPAGCER